MIVVVGAGLAGLTYAFKAVKNGEKVEVWEKSQVLGSKPCGEAVLYNALDYLPLTEREKSDVTLNSIKRVRLKFPEAERVITVSGAVIVDKRRLLETLAEVVESEGVKVLRGKPFTRDTKLDANIVDASGFVRVTHVGEGTVAPVLRGYHRSTGVICDDELLVEFDGEGMGYFWVFPYGDNYNVGFGGLYPSLKTKLGQYLTKYGLNNPYDVRGAGIVVSGPVKQRRDYVGNIPVIRIGESAGMVNPLLGEGNREAILDALGDADIRRRVKNASTVFKIIARVGIRQAFWLASKLSDKELEDVLEGRRGL